ncbi:ImmA/IrrE family metallo-endopeptidase [Alcanivorax sp. 24]|uniref:ImmA/IrrE family metallo-endopeptidase n=1 Tax=Alcanivorax sp. 24 TaxID=2545266 RepID=UPI00105CC3C6|nr:ImmA/IrrE family metallo-endopeptidase [Alcanivorax sp. 24]
MDPAIKQYIGLQARQLHGQIWSQRERLFPNGDWTPTQLCDPRIACEVLDISYEELPYIDSRFARADEGKVLAGLIDRQAGRIVVSDALPDPVMRFTAAHEVGHWCLHPGHILHRDMPVSGSDVPSLRSEIEQQADYFAACFLMPKKSIIKAFQNRFRVQLPLHFTDVLAYWLSPNDADSLISAPQSSLAREKALAQCTGLTSQRFQSLADEFKVSVGAMALRIRELGLVSWP